MTSAEQNAAAREAVARVRRARGIGPGHDCGAAADGPDRAHTDPVDRPAGLA